MYVWNVSRLVYNRFYSGSVLKLLQSAPLTYTEIIKDELPFQSMLIVRAYLVSFMSLCHCIGLYFTVLCIAVLVLFCFHIMQIVFISKCTLFLE